MESATGYVRLAEQANGPIPTPVDFPYIWGAALHELKHTRPDARIINLETSITRSNDYVPKGINYRMSPENAGCLATAGADCCVLGNNHVLDWGRAGLLDTLATLERLRIKTAGQAVMPPKRAPRRFWKSPTLGACSYFRLLRRQVAPLEIGRQRTMLPE